MSSPSPRGRSPEDTGDGGVDDSFDLEVSALSNSLSSIGGGHINESSLIDDSKYNFDISDLPDSPRTLKRTIVDLQGSVHAMKTHMDKIKTAELEMAVESTKQFEEQLGDEQKVRLRLLHQLEECRSKVEELEAVREAQTRNIDSLLMKGIAQTDQIRKEVEAKDKLLSESQNQQVRVRNLQEAEARLQELLERREVGTEELKKKHAEEVQDLHKRIQGLTDSLDYSQQFAKSLQEDNEALRKQVEEVAAKAASQAEDRLKETQALLSSQAQTIEELMDYKKRAEESLSMKDAGLMDTVQDLEGKLREVQQKVQQLQAELVRSRESSAEKLAECKAGYEERIKHLSESNKGVGAELRETWEARANEQKQRLADLTADLKAAKKDLAEAKKRSEAEREQDRRQHEEKLAQVRKEAQERIAKEAQEYKALIDNYQKQLTAATGMSQSSQQEAHAQLTAARAENAALTSQLTRAQADVETLNEKKSQLEADLASVRESLNQARSDALRAKEAAENAVEDKENIKESLEAEKAMTADLRVEVSELRARVAGLVNQIEDEEDRRDEQDNNFGKLLEQVGTLQENFDAERTGMRQAIEAQQQRITELQNEREGDQVELAQLRTVYQMAEEEKARLQEAEEKLDVALQHTKKDLEVKEKELEAALARCEALGKHTQALEKARDEAAEMARNDSAGASALEQQVRELRREAEQHKQQLGQQHAELEAVRAQKAGLEERLVTAGEAQRKLASLEKEHERVSARRDALEEKLEEERAKHIDYEVRLASLQADSRNHSNEVERYEAVCGELKAQVKDLQQKLEEAQKENLRLVSAAAATVPPGDETRSSVEKDSAEEAVLQAKLEEIETLRSNLNEKTGECGLLKVEAKNLQVALKQKTDTLEETSQLLKEQQAQRQELALQLAKAEEQLCIFRDKEERYGKQLEALQAEAAQATQEIARLQGELHTVSTSFARQEVALQQQEARAEERAQAATEAAKRTEVLQKSLEQEAARREAVHEKILALSSENAALKATQKLNEDAIGEYRERVASLGDVVEGLKARVQELEGTGRDQNHLTREARERTAGLEAQIKALEAQVRDREKEIGRLQLSLEQSQERRMSASTGPKAAPVSEEYIQSLKKERDDAQQQLQQLYELRSENKRLERENTTLTSQLDKLEAKYDALDNRSQSMREELSAAKVALQSVSSSLEAKTEQVEALKQQQQQTQAQLRQLADEKKTLEGNSVTQAAALENLLRSQGDMHTHSGPAVDGTYNQARSTRSRAGGAGHVGSDAHSGSGWEVATGTGSTAKPVTAAVVQELQERVEELEEQLSEERKAKKKVMDKVANLTLANEANVEALVDQNSRLMASTEQLSSKLEEMQGRLQKAQNAKQEVQAAHDVLEMRLENAKKEMKKRDEDVALVSDELVAENERKKKMEEETQHVRGHMTKWTKDKDQLEKEVQRLEAQVQELAMSEKKLNQDLVRAEAEIHRLNEYNRVLERAKEDAMAAQSAHTSVHEDLLQMQADLTKARMREVELQSTTESLQKRIENLNQELGLLSAESEKQDASYHKLKKEKEAMRRDLESAQDEVNSLKKKLKSAVADLEDEHAKAESKKKAVHGLEDKLHDAVKKRKAAEDQVAELERRVQAVEKEKERSEKHVQEARQVAETLQQTHRQLQNAVKKARADAEHQEEDLRAELQQVRMEATRTQHELEADLQQAQLEASRLQAEVTRRASDAKAQDELREARGRVQQLQHDLERKSLEVQALQADVKQARAEASQYQSEVENIRNQQLENPHMHRSHISSGRSLPDSSSRPSSARSAAMPADLRLAQDRLVHLEGQVKKYQKSLEATQSVLRDREAEIRSLTSQLDGAEARCNDLEAEEVVLREEHVRLKHAADQALEKLRRDGGPGSPGRSGVLYTDRFGAGPSEDTARVQGLLREKNDEIARLKESVSASKAEVETAKDRLRSMAEDVSAKTEEYLDVKKELESTKDALKKAQRDVQDARSMETQLDSALARVHALEGDTRRNKELAADLSRMEADNQSLRKAKAALEDECHQLESAKQQLSARVSEAERMRGAVDGELAWTKGRLEELKEQYQLLEKQSINRASVEEWTALQNERDELQDRVRGLQHDIHTANERAQVQATTIEDLLSQVQKAQVCQQDDVPRFQAQIKDLQAALASSEDEVGRLEAKVKQLDDQGKAQAMVVESLKEALNHLKAAAAPAPAPTRGSVSETVYHSPSSSRQHHGRTEAGGAGGRYTSSPVRGQHASARGAGAGAEYGSPARPVVTGLAGTGPAECHPSGHHAHGGDADEHLQQVLDKEQYFLQRVCKANVSHPDHYHKAFLTASKAVPDNQVVVQALLESRSGLLSLCERYREENQDLLKALIATSAAMKVWWKKFKGVLRDKSLTDSDVCRTLSKWKYFDNCPWEAVLSNVSPERASQVGMGGLMEASVDLDTVRRKASKLEKERDALLTQRDELLKQLKRFAKYYETESQRKALDDMATVEELRDHKHERDAKIQAVEVDMTRKEAALRSEMDLLTKQLNSASARCVSQSREIDRLRALVAADPNLSSGLDPLHMPSLRQDSPEDVGTLQLLDAQSVRIHRLEQENRRCREEKKAAEDQCAVFEDVKASLREQLHVSEQKANDLKQLLDKAMEELQHLQQVERRLLDKTESLNIERNSLVASVNDLKARVQSLQKAQAATAAAVVSRNSQRDEKEVQALEERLRESRLKKMAYKQQVVRLQATLKQVQHVMTNEVRRLKEYQRRMAEEAAERLRSFHEDVIRKTGKDIQSLCGIISKQAEKLSLKKKQVHSLEGKVGEEAGQKQVLEQQIQKLEQQVRHVKQEAEEARRAHQREQEDMKKTLKETKSKRKNQRQNSVDRDRLYQLEKQHEVALAQISQMQAQVKDMRHRIEEKDSMIQKIERELQDQQGRRAQGQGQGQGQADLGVGAFRVRYNSDIHTGGSPTRKRHPRITEDVVPAVHPDPYTTLRSRASPRRGGHTTQTYESSYPVPQGPSMHRGHMSSEGDRENQVYRELQDLRRAAQNEIHSRQSRGLPVEPELENYASHLHGAIHKLARHDR